MADPKLVVRIFGDDSQLSKTLAAVQRNIKSTFGKTTLDASKEFASSLKYVTVAGAAFAATCVKMAGNLEMTRRAFETLTGDVDMANAHIQDLEKFAAKTPFQFNELATASKQMQAYGFHVSEVIPMLRTLGDATMAVGLGEEGLNRIVLAMGQIEAKGRVSAEEMRQLAETGLPVWQMLATEMEVSVGRVRKMAEEGLVSSTQGINAILSQMTTRYGGMMAKMEREIPQGLSNAQDNIQSIMRTIGRDITEAFNLKEALYKFNEQLSNFADLAKQSGVASALEQAIPDSWKATLAATAGVIGALLVPAFLSLATAVGTFIIAAGPLLAVGAAIGFIVSELTGFTSITKNTIDKMTDSLPDFQRNVINSARGRRAGGTFVPVAETPTSIDPKFGDVARMRAEEAKQLEIYNKQKLELARQEKEAAAQIAADKAAQAEEQAKKAAEAEKKRFEQLREEAKRTSDRITDQWLEMTGTQGQILDKWYQDELENLEKSKKANDNYQQDLLRLDETYKAKRQELAKAEAQERIATFKTITDGYNAMQKSITEKSLIGESKDIFKMEDELRSSQQSISQYFEGIQNTFTTGNKKAQQDILDALTANGIEYKRIEQDKLDFSTEIERRQAEAYKTYLDDKTMYYKTASDVESNIEAAKSQRSIELLNQLVEYEDYVRQSRAEADLLAMETYIQLQQWGATSFQEIWANAQSVFIDGLPTAISNMVMGIETAEEAFKKLGQSVISMIVKMGAEWLVGQMFREKTMLASTAKQVAVSKTAGATVAAAWAAAAANVSLATFGANAAAAQAGIGATHAFTALLSVPKFAKGGIITGPTLGLIGEGKDPEAVFPLNSRSFNMLAEGIQKAKGQGGNDNSVTTVNIYGDITNAGDEGRIFESLFSDTGFALMGG